MRAGVPKKQEQGSMVQYRTRLDPLVRRQMIRWGLSDSLLVDVHLHLNNELPSSPTSFLQKDLTWAGGEGLVYDFQLVDPDNRMLVHAFRFQVFYLADETTLLVAR